jgi:hypothetical protein
MSRQNISYGKAANLLLPRCKETGTIALRKNGFFNAKNRQSGKYFAC